MGLSFRKSIKLFGNTRINFSKTGGIGISTGVKGARVSVNQKGVRTTIGKAGLQYRKDYSFKQNKRVNNQNIIEKQLYDKNSINNLKINAPKMSIETTNKIFKWFGTGIITLLIGAIIFPPILLISVVAFLYAFKNIFFSKEFRSILKSNKAINCYKSGRYDQARKYCDKALKICSENGSAKDLISILEASK